jgi:hypothetical protein
MWRSAKESCVNIVVVFPWTCDWAVVVVELLMVRA